MGDSGHPYSTPLPDKIPFMRTFYQISLIVFLISSGTFEFLRILRHSLLFTLSKACLRSKNNIQTFFFLSSFLSYLVSFTNLMRFTWVSRLFLKPVCSGTISSIEPSFTPFWILFSRMYYIIFTIGLKIVIGRV